MSRCTRSSLCESARVHSREKLAKNELFNWLFWVFWVEILENLQNRGARAVSFFASFSGMDPGGLP